jgi:hypothetical protein
MRCRTLLATALVAAACHGDDGTRLPDPFDASESNDGRASSDSAVVDSSPTSDATHRDGALALDAPSAGDAGVTCARAPLGEWIGASVMKDGGAGGFSSTRADVRWRLDSSEACIDRYYPTGTVSFTFREQCRNTIEPASIALMPSDGSLTIDRRRLPVTYEIRGATTWDASITCEGDPAEPPVPVGGPWALGRGSFDGDVIAGGFFSHDDAADWWEARRVDATFESAAPDCVEPAVDHLWGTASVSSGSEATVTWKRVSTDGCVDRFQPSGVATAPTVNDTCSTIVTDPASVPIASSDGELVITRFSRPITVKFRGDTSWRGARTCTRPDGNTSLEHGTMGGAWGGFVETVWDGTAFNGSTTFNDVDYRWSLTRLPPAEAVASQER